MTTSFENYTIDLRPPLTGGIPNAVPRTLPSHLGDVINVKDFGAVGDGSHDDTDAIQAAINTAWGNPRATGTVQLATDHTPLFFPSGKYRILHPIFVQGVLGGWLLGEGSGTTILYYDGAVPNALFGVSRPFLKNAYNKTSVFFCNGVNFTRIEGITFEMKPGVNSVSDNTVGFNYNWCAPADPFLGGPNADRRDGISLPPPDLTTNSSLTCFIDVGFKRCSIGVACGDGEGAPGWGEQGDSCMWINCWADDCAWGVRTFHLNAIACGWVGGSITNCIVGMNCKLPVNTVDGVRFSGNGVDIAVEHAPMVISNCTTDSPHFLIISGAAAAVEGCVQEAAGAVFLQGAKDNLISIDACKANGGTITGSPSLFMSDTTGIAGPPYGYICENERLVGVGSTPLNFVDLPNITDNAGQGLIMSIKDAPSAALFDPISGGSGTNHVLLLATGNNARGSITFSTQPSVGNTITVQAATVTMAALVNENFDLGLVGIQATLALTVDRLASYFVQTFHGVLDGVMTAPTGAPHNKLQLTATRYGTGGNTFALSTTVSGTTVVPFAGGTAPVWHVIGK